jgi:hypothetical protein
MGALTDSQKEKLRLAYFTPSEIAEFDEARSVDGSLQRLNVSADNFQTMVRNRVRFVERLKDLGWSRGKVAALITSYYVNKRSKRSVFDMLQVEASPSARQKGESDNSIARRLLKLSRVRASFGTGYSRGVDNTIVPRNIPQVPDF